MAFNVNDVVKKKGLSTQKYKVSEVNDSKCKCVYEPLVNSTIVFTFKEDDLELVEG